MEVLADWEGQAAWMPDVAWIRLIGTEREEGARLEVRTRVFGLPAATDRIRVTVWDPPRELAVVHEGVVGGRGSWVLQPSPSRDAAAVDRGACSFPGGARATWPCEPTLRGRWPCSDDP